jgi:glycosyltransferase involved in cell wall biosynthesis
MRVDATPVTTTVTELGGEPIVSIVIPAYNERESVHSVVADTCRALSSTELDPFEIVVVDDGSTDGTAQLLDTIAAADARVRVIHRHTNGGFGAALKTGYGAAHGQLVIAIPADGQCPPGQVLELARAMGDADVIVSGRYHEGKTLDRVALTLLWQLLTRLLMGFDPRGMDGIYLIRRSVLSGLPLVANTGLINFEILRHCTRQKRRIRKHLLPVEPRRGGVSKVTNARAIARVVREMIRLRVRS